MKVLAPCPHYPRPLLASSLLPVLAMLACVPVSSAAPWPLKDKTLVAWVSPANLTQRGGSVLTMEKSGGVFDGIVYGEITPATWMPGSDGFRRTKREQGDFPKETAANPPVVQVAIVYEGREITLYRNGQAAASYTAEGAERFPSDSLVLMGLRHLDAGAENRFFIG